MAHAVDAMEAHNSHIKQIQGAIKKNQKALARLKETLDGINATYARTAAQLKDPRQNRKK